MAPTDRWEQSDDIAVSDGAFEAAVGLVDGHADPIPVGFELRLQTAQRPEDVIGAA